MQSLQKWREPAAFVALVAVGLNLAGVLVGLVDVATSAPGGLGASAVGFGVRAADAPGLALLAVLVALCHRPEPTARVRGLSLAAMVVASVSLATGVVLLGVGLAGRPTVDPASLLLVLAGLAVPVLALGALVVLLRSCSPNRAVEAPAAPAPRPVPAAPEAPDPARQPTWEPDAASGAAWLTAGAAAAGASPAGWGRPGEAAGWHPPTPPAPDAPAEHAPGADGAVAPLPGPPTSTASDRAPSAAPHPWSVEPPPGPDTPGS